MWSSKRCGRSIVCMACDWWAAGTGDRHEQAHGARGAPQDDGRDSPHFWQHQAQHGQLQRPHPGSLWWKHPRMRRHTHTHTHSWQAPAVTWHVTIVMLTENWTYMVSILHIAIIHSIPVFNVRQSYCARYGYRLDVCLFVCPSHAGIVSKRVNLSSNCLHCLVAPWF